MSILPDMPPPDWSEKCLFLYRDICLFLFDLFPRMGLSRPIRFLLLPVSCAWFFAACLVCLPLALVGVLCILYEEC